MDVQKEAKENIRQFFNSIIVVGIVATIGLICNPEPIGTTALIFTLYILLEAYYIHIFPKLRAFLDAKGNHQQGDEKPSNNGR